VSSSRSDNQKSGRQVEEYLTFFIAEVEYAVSLDYVREVIPYDTVTRVPGMPDTVRGVTNLRGSVVPVIDLAIKFRLPAIEVTSRTCIVLVETDVGGTSILLGLLTEQVGQVLAVDRKELLPPPPFGTPVHTDYLVGMLQVGKKFALVLQIQRALSQDELLAAPESGDGEAAPSSDGAPVVEVADDLDDEAWDAAEPVTGGGESQARSQ
jgi:purine-binding chemotaxis protein CheW